jgi:ABC-type phosphate transport system substrate-binding protein
MLREPGDSGERTVATHWPDLYEAMDEARRSRRWPVQSTDQEMLAALRDTPGSVGLLDVGLATGLGLTMPFIDGVRPDAATLAEGGWPLMRQLHAMLPPEPSQEAQRWIAAAEVALNPLPSGWVPVQIGGAP